jgi:hypothetical protein
LNAKTARRLQNRFDEELPPWGRVVVILNNGQIRLEITKLNRTGANRDELEELVDTIMWEEGFFCL